MGGPSDPPTSARVNTIPYQYQVWIVPPFAHKIVPCIIHASCRLTTFDTFKNIVLRALVKHLNFILNPDTHFADHRLSMKWIWDSGTKLLNIDLLPEPIAIIIHRNWSSTNRFETFRQQFQQISFPDRTRRYTNDMTPAVGLRARQGSGRTWTTIFRYQSVGQKRRRMMASLGRSQTALGLGWPFPVEAARESVGSSHSPEPYQTQFARKRREPPQAEQEGKKRQLD